MDIKYKKSKKKGQHSKVTQNKPRAKCDCEATQHPLINNCIFCGRIVCESEGPGPCFFCGKNVDANQGKRSGSQYNFKEKDLYDKESFGFVSQEILKKRDKLLDFDKNETSRTSVIDDECDYYSTNNTWLSNEERKKLAEKESKLQDKKHESRLKKKMNIDLYGRVCVNEDEELINQYYDPASISNAPKIQDEEIKRHYSDIPKAFNDLVYISDGTTYKTPQDINEHISSRVQDKNLLEISDDGACLSLHQPYASLLVRGIKRVEGRTWYTPHRGRLWIASTIKEPSIEEIKAVENHYLAKYNGNVNFPKTYPSGCLLGFVTVVDVVPQEEFQHLEMVDDNDSPYLFLCDNFFELPLKYPIKGKYKIYKLEQPIHRAALNVFEKATKKQESN